MHGPFKWIEQNSVEVNEIEKSTSDWKMYLYTNTKRFHLTVVYLLCLNGYGAGHRRWIHSKSILSPRYWRYFCYMFCLFPNK